MGNVMNKDIEVWTTRLKYHVILDLAKKISGKIESLSVFYLGSGELVPKTESKGLKK